MPVANRGGKRAGAGRPAAVPTKVVRLPVPVIPIVRRLADAFNGNVSEILSVDGRTAATIPLVSSVAACGFPSPADDYLDRALDFNDLLIQNPAATFAVRVAGESMTGAGLFPGDIAIVDKSLTPTNGSIIVALIDGEFTIKRFCRVDGQIVLLAENPHFPNIEITEQTGLEVWGVVTNAIRKLR